MSQFQFLLSGSRAKKTRPTPQRRDDRRRLFLEVLEDRTLLSAVSPLSDQLQQAYGQIPLSFEANRGQDEDTQVQFLSRGSGYVLFLTPLEAVLRLSRP